MGKTTAKVLRVILTVLGVLVLMFLVSEICLMLELTTVNRWVFFGVITAVSAVTGTFFHRAWAKLTGVDKFALNFPIHLVVFTIVISSALLMGNYFATDFDSLPEQEVVIEKRLRKTRYRTRRVSRRSYVRGAPYHVYYLQVSLPDGTPKEFYVKKSVYDKTRSGDTVTIRMGRGALSFPVLNANSLQLRVDHSSSSRKSRCKFFGTSGS